MVQAITNQFWEVWHKKKWHSEEKNKMVEDS